MKQLEQSGLYKMILQKHNMLWKTFGKNSFLINVDSDEYWRCTTCTVTDFNSISFLSHSQFHMTESKSAL